MGRQGSAIDATRGGQARRSAFFFLCLALFLGLWPGPVCAAPPADALNLYREGRYDAAAEAAGAAGTADGLALAARASLAAALLRHDGPARLARIEAASAYAEDAIAGDPENVEGHLQAAIALAYRARYLGTLAAYRRGFVTRAREHIESALAAAPENPYALAVDGGWHLEVAARAGSFAGRLMFGADARTGMERFNAAMAADPYNPGFPYQYALSLLAADAPAYAVHSQGLLRRALALQPRDAFEADLLARAGDLLTALEAGTETPDFAATLRAHQGYPEPEAE